MLSGCECSQTTPWGGVLKFHCEVLSRSWENRLQCERRVGYYLARKGKLVVLLTHEDKELVSWKKLVRQDGKSGKHL